MMLHEAVMLEIYRQALSASELASPRCQSRESHNSTLQSQEGRCPSNDSQCSANDGSNTINQMSLTATTPPVALPLPATLAPAAAAALLPPQSAAMAAYLNAAAAAAAQQNHLLLTNPLAAAASLVQQATQQVSNVAHLPVDDSRQTISATPSTAELAEAAALDFSTKGPHNNRQRGSREAGNDGSEEDGEGDDDDEGNGDGDANAEGDGNGVDDRNDHDDERDCFSNNENDGDIDEANSPLDLSLNTGRHKRQLFDNDHEDEEGEESSLIMPTTRKMLRSNEYKTLTLSASSTWMPPINPYLAAVAAASGLASPNKPTLNNQLNHQQQHLLEWNHKGKIAPNEATKALEKMTEMTRIAATSNDMDLIKTRQHSAASTPNNSSSNSITITAATASITPTASTTTTTSGATTNGRHSAWQSHWLNKGADAVRDVFKCVWCKQSFATLASLTAHMKETQHCGVHVASSVNNNSSHHNNNNSNNSNSNTNSNSNNHHHHQVTQSNHSYHRHSIATQGHALNGKGHNANTNTTVNTNSNGIGIGNGSVNNNSGNNALPSSTTTGNKSDLNMLIKETMPLPRKLVRGQDVWLGKGAEQTRQILKCMWCGQSFRSLAEMTAHMQETQHYTNIISQEQIISWKSSDDKHSRDRDRDSSTLKAGRSTSSPNTTAPTLTATSAAASGLPATVANGGGNNNSLCAVLTCKVCEQAFPTLKELSNHMIKNNHYKEHMMRAGGGCGAGGGQQINEPMPTMIRSGVGGGGSGSGKGRQTKEKRKKSLPVRKLLEMERAQLDYKTASSLDQALKPLRDFAASTKITCEKCNEKIETALFVDHIRQCIDSSIMISPRSNNHYHNSNNNSHNNNNNSNSHNAQHRHTIKSNYRHNNSVMNEQVRSSPRSLTGRKNSENSRLSSPIGSHSEILCPLPADNEKPTEGSSVLSALEQLIEKSFDTRPRLGLGNAYDNSSANTTPLGSSILKRLGIDDTMDYTKPLMDPQTMQFLRSYSNYPSSSSIRDRSASESSSISERGGGGGSSSRLDAFTPDMLKNDYSSRQTTPRLTPEKLVPPNRDRLDYVHIKSEPLELTEQTTEDRNSQQDMEIYGTDEKIMINDLSQKISVKKEFAMAMDNDMTAHEQNSGRDHEHGRRDGSGQNHINDMDLRIMHTRNTSPSLSDRSLTPKSTTSSLNERKEPSFQIPSTVTSSTATTPTARMASTTATAANEGGSLNALSSMFNNLSNNLNSSNLSAINCNALDAITTNIHCSRVGGGGGPDDILGSGNSGGSCRGGNSGKSGHKKTNANPLAALQKLCETTDTPPAANTRSSANSNSHNNHHNHLHQQQQQQPHQQSSSSLQTASNNSGSSSSSSSGSNNSAIGSIGNSNMIAFGWPCNDTQHPSDSLIKCSFCDIPFNSKGAYRHHLSKIHFIKDINGGDINNISNNNVNSSSVKPNASIQAGGVANIKSPPTVNSPKSLQPSPNRNSTFSMAKSKSPAVQRLDGITTTTTATKSTTPTSNSSNSSTTTPTINPYDESAQAKFLKYAELARQLSSKNS